MLRRALASPRLWLFSVILWALALYFLSALPRVAPIEGPKIPHFDKVMHFGYFMGGAFIFTTWILLRKGRAACRSRRIVFPLLLFAVIGALDEWHQTFTPGRSGNDPFDWLADVLGAAAGTFIAHLFHAPLVKICSHARIP